MPLKFMPEEEIIYSSKGAFFSSVSKLYSSKIKENDESEDLADEEREN